MLCLFLNTIPPMLQTQMLGNQKKHCLSLPFFLNSTALLPLNMQCEFLGMSVTYPGLNTHLSYFRGTSEHRWSSRGSVILAGWGFFAFLNFRGFLNASFLLVGWKKLICFCNVFSHCVTTNYWNKPLSVNGCKEHNHNKMTTTKKTQNQTKTL